MNIAIITAGGSGKRLTLANKPKQFLEVYQKPIIVYTVEKFQNCKSIDKVIIVAKSDWIKETRKIIKQFGLTKVDAVVSGGKTGQESIYKGLKEASKLYPENSLILIHDSVRPLIDTETIEKCILVAKKHGNAITVSQATETMVKTNSNREIEDVYKREESWIARAPQCFILNQILAAHKTAIKNNKLNYIDSASLMKENDYKLKVVEGPAENIKITSDGDYYIFKSILDAKNAKQNF